MRITDNIHCVLLLALLVSAIIGCHPSPATKTTSSPAPSGNLDANSKTTPAPLVGDSSASSAPQPIPIKPNVSHVNATVVLVSLLDSVDFNVSVRVNDAAPVGSMLSLALPGMTLGLKPRFMTDNSGDIDTTNERNLRLLTVRLLKTGDDFHGKVSQQAPGLWMLMDVDEK